MTNIPGTDTYYYNTTLTEAGGKNTPDYTYHIWADDTNGNYAESASEDFALPMNEDVNKDGKVHFMDLVAASMAYNDEGLNG